MKDRNEQQIRDLLKECGLVSKDSALSHSHVQEHTAKIIHNLPKPYRDSLLSLLSWMNYEIETK